MNCDPTAVTVTIDLALDGIRVFDVSFTAAIEMLRILGMGKWEAHAPQPGKFGIRGGVRAENS